MSRYVVQLGWDDVPHLTSAQKADMLSAIPPFQRDARSKGIPQLGSGAIYPVEESSITVADFPIPKHWKRCYGLDVGWNFTAAGFWARDPDTGISYMYRCFKEEKKRPSEIVRLLHDSDGRIRGTIDPASRGRSQSDGEQLLQTYRDLGADLFPANNSVEAGIYEVWQRMVSGRIKIFMVAGRPMLAEYRQYQRDEKGRVVKTNDHLMDGGLRYPIMSFLVDGVPMTEPVRAMSEEERAMWGATDTQAKMPSIGGA